VFFLLFSGEPYDLLSTAYETEPLNCYQCKSNIHTTKPILPINVYFRLFPRSHYYRTATRQSPPQEYLGSALQTRPTTDAYWSGKLPAIARSKKTRSLSVWLLGYSERYGKTEKQPQDKFDKHGNFKMKMK
jgi:hypothetical protein